MNPVNVHADSLKTSSELSDYYVEAAIAPLDVIAILNKAGISFVLAGAHAIGGWMRDPRSTKDVNLIIASKHAKKAARVLGKAFPDLEAEDLAVVIHLRERESKKVVIDLMKPVQPLYREAFKHTHTVIWEGQRFRIPSLETALAMKFAAMISPNREDEDKHQDAHDFIRMVKQNDDIDRDQLAQLGGLAFPGGGKRVLELVRKVRAGEKLVL